MSIKINISGTIFETTKTTILKINYFKYLSEDSNLDLNTTIPFVDRPAHIFKHVLALAQDDTYPYPIKYKSELDFYDMVYDVRKLYDTNEEKLNKVISLLSNPSKIPGKCSRNDCDTEEYENDDADGYCYNHWKVCDYINPVNGTYCDKMTDRFINFHYKCKSHVGL